MDLLNIFQNIFRQTSANDLLSANSSSAYAATLQGRTPDPRGPTSRTPSPNPPRECVCGKQHWFNDCFYLMESKRPHGWKPNTEIMKKVEEALKNPILRGKVEKIKQREKRYQERFQTSASASASPTPELPSEPQVPRSFATTWYRASAAITDTPIPSSYSVDKAVNHDILNC